MRSPIVLTVAGALALLLTVSSHDTAAQSSTRPSPSPLAPGDGNRPIFDTASPQYNGADAQARARDTVVAEVEGRAITLGQVRDRISGMPTNIAALPFDVLFPAMVDQLIRREALVARVRRLGLDDDPMIRRRIAAAADEVLAGEGLGGEAAGKVTDAQVMERYRAEYAGKPGPEEVHVRLIYVHTEAEASAAIARLKAGEDFAAVARAVSKDVSVATGGDLGFVARDGLNAEVGAVAFALPPGQFSAYPVRGPAGWFVVKSEARRSQPTQPLAVVREQIRATLAREASFTITRAAIADVIIHQYGLVGKMVDSNLSVGQ